MGRHRLTQAHICGGCEEPEPGCKGCEDTTQVGKMGGYPIPNLAATDAVEEAIKKSRRAGQMIYTPLVTTDGGKTFEVIAMGDVPVTAYEGHGIGLGGAPALA